MRLSGPSLPEILLVSLLNLLPPWCRERFKCGCHESMMSFFEGSQNYGHPKKKFALRISTVNCLGKKNLWCRCIFNYETRRAMPRWESPNLDINIANFHDRQLVGLWFALWHQWPASRVSFFAELRLDSVDYMLNSWQWNSSSYRWRFNFSDFLRLGLGNFVRWMSKVMMIPEIYVCRLLPELILFLGEGWIPKIYWDKAADLTQGKSHKAFYKAYLAWKPQGNSTSF